MRQRINVHEKGSQALKAMYALGGYMRKSQLNTCAFCLGMHSKDLRAAGQTEQHLYVLDAWREAPFYTGKERAAAAWAEALTKITGGFVSDEIYNQ